MKKWWTGFRKASDLREREENLKIKNNLYRKMSDLLDHPTSASEAEIIAALKAWKKDMTEEEAREYVRRLRNEASALREHDPERH